MAKQQKAGIYKITNITNNKSYIGQSSNLSSRWWKHQWFLNHNQHHNCHLQNAWNYYGCDSFEFSIIEYCDENELDQHEIHYIEKYNTFNDGYNLDKGGKGTRGYKHTDDEINRMRRIQNPPVVLQFDLEFNLIYRWIGGFTHIAKVMGKNWTRQCISIRCRHLIRKMSPYNNFYWVYEDEYNSPDFTWEKYLDNIPATKIGAICKLETQHIIYQFDKLGNFIRKWNNINDLLDIQYDVDRIRMCCHHTGKVKSYKNYIWTYSLDDINSEYFSTIINKAKGNSLSA